MADLPQPDQAQDFESLSFEAAFQKLAGLVESLEKGGLTLDEATGYYEQGMSLVRRCNQLLNEAELKVRQLQNTNSLLSDGLESEEEEE